MPFKKMDQFKTMETYIAALKKVLMQLNDEPGEFYFYDGVNIGNKKESVLLVGDIKAEVMKGLKAASASRGYGQYQLKGKTLELAIETGKMPETKIKPIFSDLPYKVKLVSGFDAVSAGDEKLKQQVEAKLRAVTAIFDKIKGAIGDGPRKVLRQVFGDISALMEKADYSGADADKAYKKLLALDKAVKKAAEQALKDQQETLKARTDGPDSEDRKLAGWIKEAQGKIESAQNAVSRETELLNRLQSELPSVRKPNDIKKKQAQIDSCEKRLAAEQTTLDKVKQEMVPVIKDLQGRKDDNAKKLAAVMNNLGKQVGKLQSDLKADPVRAAKDALRETVQKMSEANKWTEEQMNRTDDSHGTARHGAQTGLHKQARRAGTTQSVTPDQANNKSGTTQYIKKWHKVEFEYEEDGNGQRVIKNKKKVEKNIVEQVNRTFGSSTGSMWATPVLEKEAVDTAMKHAAKFKDFTHYHDGSDWQELESLTFVLGKPTRGPGWGYAVKKSGANVDIGVAQTLMKDFEEGKKTLDQLFSGLNVSLLTDGSGGAKLIPNCRVVLTRSNNTADWKEKTHFPDDRLGNADIGWECKRDWKPGTVKFRDAAGKEQNMRNTVLP